MTLISEDGGTRYEVIIQGDDIEGKIDGKRLPDKLVRRTGDGVILLGKDGEVLQRFGLTTQGQRGRTIGWVGDPGSNVVLDRYLASDVDVEFDNHPPVMVGINQTEVPEEMRWHLRLPEDARAILVDNVIKGLPAEKAGLKRYDVIVSIDGSDGATSQILRERLMDKHPGEEIKLEVLSRGERKKLIVELAPYDGGKLAPSRGVNVGRGVARVAPDFPDAPDAPRAPGVYRFRFGDEGVAELAELAELGEYGQALRERTERAIIAQLREHGLDNDEDLRLELAPHLKEMEEALRDKLAASEDQVRAAKEAMEIARQQMIELRDNQLVLPERNAWVGNQAAATQERLVEMEHRLSRLEDRMNERMDRLFERMDRLLDKVEED